MWVAADLPEQQLIMARRNDLPLRRLDAYLQMAQACTIPPFQRTLSTTRVRNERVKESSVQKSILELPKTSHKLLVLRQSSPLTSVPRFQEKGGNLRSLLPASWIFVPSITISNLKVEMTLLLNHSCKFGMLRDSGTYH